MSYHWALGSSSVVCVQSSARSRGTLKASRGPPSCPWCVLFHARLSRFGVTLRQTQPWAKKSCREGGANCFFSPWIQGCELRLQQGKWVATGRAARGRGAGLSCLPRAPSREAKCVTCWIMERLICENDVLRTKMRTERRVQTPNGEPHACQPGPQ